MKKNYKDNMLNVVYVMGTSHCGSTLLAFLLNTHPQIFSIGEFGAQGRRIKRNRCSCQQYTDECPLWTEVSPRVKSEYGLNFDIADGSAQYGFSHRHLRHWLNTIKTNSFLEAMRQFVLAINPYYQLRRKQVAKLNYAVMKICLELTRKNVFADTSKSPFRFLELEKIPELNIKVIWLVRDVRGFVNSSKRKNRDLKEAAKRWQNDQRVIKHIFEKLPEEKKLLVRYEDLCSQPVEKMQEVFGFIGVSDYVIPNDYKSVPHHIFGNRMKGDARTTILADDKWKMNLSKQEQEEAIRAGGQIAEYLGYH